MAFSALLTTFIFIRYQVNGSNSNGIWYRMKMKVVSNEKKATVYGKVWKKSDPEPEAWTITVDDPHPIAGGTPGLLGYSPVNLFYDNVTVYPN